MWFQINDSTENYNNDEHGGEMSSYMDPLTSQDKVINQKYSAGMFN